MRPPAEDFNQRRPVWEALSELFLDNELDEHDRNRIAAGYCEHPSVHFPSALKESVLPLSGR